MTIFDYFRVLRRLAAAPRAPAARHSRANTLPIRFECLESRCLLSLAPPVATFIDADDLQVSKSSDTALVSRVSSNADGEAYIPIAGQLNSPTSPAYSLRPTWPDSANYWPGLPTGGQYSGRPLPGTQASPPMSGDLPGSPPLGGLIEIGPKQSQFTPMAAPEPSFSSKEAHDVLDMLSTLKYVPVPHRADDSHQPLPIPQLGASGQTASTPDALKQHSADTAEGGMITLRRQASSDQSATEESLSVAAIDALLEIPTKVDGLQGKFQAFEISVAADAQLPIVSPPSGAKLELPLRFLGDQLSPAATSSPHTADTSQNTGGAITAPDESAEVDAAPFGELTPEAIDEAFNSTLHLDLATATVLAALVGRALWPARSAAPRSKEKPQLPPPRPTHRRPRLAFARFTAGE